ncbi:hypothetical protein LPB140_09300 [Sphingorhabdus lutea]|uniref:histidine kinase n=1 Tax=Sphingorhabdus lutea TaxID=1913578 RepID=A0A1L3JD13_9SPHN|nr:XrtA/PEP-CTERM system histidine kinase PrsK [Sphingorhabdus lutea]APG62953.1 hypothetical protein LPB140_09300 [Sphingorhabdus lutea]
MLEILANLSFWGHLTAAFAYVMMAIWLLHKYGSSSAKQLMMIIALSVTAIWAFATTVSGVNTIYAQATETVRNLAWFSFLFFLLKGEDTEEQPRTVNILYAVVAAILMIQLGVDLATHFIFNAGNNVAVAISSLILRVLFAIGALVALHNIYTITAPMARWGINLPLAALTSMWAFDLNLYTIAYLTREIPIELQATRGIMMAIIAPIFIIASRRNSAWKFRLSRSVAFQSVSLIAIGIYLLLMLFLATLLEFFFEDYAALAQITLIFGMSVGALLILPSGKFRSWLRVFIAKHFFQHRYDYRSEWMRFADTIGFPGEENTPFHERIVKAMADIMDCPSGLLLTPTNDKQLNLQARWNWRTADVPAIPATKHSASYFENTKYIVNLDDARAGTDNKIDPTAIPNWLYEQENAWLMLPLVHFGKLTGLIILAKPRIMRGLDWEDLDMIRTVSRQLASYLAEASSQRQLIESRQFTEFNRRFAFIMHDIKNLVSQLSILARNAEKHADKPEFRADMIDTLKSSVEKMNALLARLSSHNKAVVKPLIAMDIGEIVLKSVHSKRLLHPMMVNVSEGLFAMIDAERLETILNHLLQNAIEATDDGSPIDINAKKLGENIEITVQDNGSGMSEHFVANDLFRPFHSSKADGFGIGAYEALTLTKSLGGELKVMSKLGEGTKFIISIPIENNKQAKTDNAKTDYIDDANHEGSI